MTGDQRKPNQLILFILLILSKNTFLLISLS